MANFNDPFFNDGMDDFFNQLMHRMDGQQPKYVVNGHELTPEEAAQLQSGNVPVATKQKPEPKSILEKLGRDLTQEARDGLLDPVIGRDKEIQEAAEVLSRRTKNNPILVGDAGVGKTAVVEGLAQAIVKGNVPAAIQNKSIIAIDLANLEAGTQYRGSFEQNIQDLIKAVKKRGNVILFFDEIHQILGAGSTGESGSKGLADIIKPALSRGELTVIGATTQDEYRNTIMKDAALARRFNDITVNQPSAETTFKILQGLRKLYEQHHHVQLPDAVLKACVDYSVQYLPQRSLPDKAIDLLDMTAAHLAAQHPVLDEVALKQQVEQFTQQKDAAAKAEDFEKAASLKKQLADVQAQLDHGDAKQHRPNGNARRCRRSS
jgi:ATP-dependent Clp protease ATP-binding subunit ClpL